MDRLRRMEIFVAIVETGQITRAGELLRLSKSAVSHALTDLETHLGIKLLSRNGRSWDLTEAGTDYYENCKKIIHDIEIMEDQAQSVSRNLSGLVRISAPDTFGSYTLVPVITKFMDMHPDIVIELNLTERYVDLIEERVDIAFRTGSFKHTGLEVRKIGEAEMMICASPAYVKLHGEPSSHRDLKHHNLITYTRSPEWRMSKNGRSYEFLPKASVLTDSGETMREFCIRGRGLAFMPSTLGEFALKKKRLKRVLTDYEFTKMPVQAVSVTGKNTSRRVTKLLDFIVEELRSRPRDISEFIDA